MELQLEGWLLLAALARSPRPRSSQSLLDEVCPRPNAKRPHRRWVIRRVHLAAEFRSLQSLLLIESAVRVRRRRGEVFEVTDAGRQVLADAADMRPRP
ncbi:protein of unknown function [Modestobacter italicus]|uniref:Transcriptional regulator n=1 Tax=Modestobacter italicus (strain DSM 44449 / CECT 9708 / BC 501) TaxID=2732864 RepID=I4F0J4_MODI5|nr:protein of unknown function [Modestobacter marinus]